MSRPPLSPLSLSSNDSGIVGRFPSGPTALSSDIPYSGGPYGAARPPQTSPPSSQHPSNSTNMSQPSAASSRDRPPSSASSIGMSNDGRMPKLPPNNRDSARSNFRPEGEDQLQRHYGALKRYLAAHLHDEKGNMRPNRARDKLLRLSATQFMELSTDVYDELMRREDERTQRVENVPRFLLPRQNFHPKRNQARQKLSTLPIERFRQLATDVFYELERRIPRFAGDSISRPMSTNSNASNRSRAPSRGGMRPPPPGFGGPPFPPGGPPGARPRMGPGGPMPPQSPYGSGFPPGSPGMPNGTRRPSEAESMSRPLPKTLQSSTMVPNKSTMVEDDDADEEEEEDVYGIDQSGRNSKDGNPDDKEKIEAQEAEIAELKAKLLETEQELEDHKSEKEQMRAQLDDVPNQQKVLLQQLDTHLSEKEELHRELLKHQGGGGSEESQHTISVLQDELAKQEKLTTQVREEATLYLREMRDLSRQNDAAIDAEEKLAARVAQQEREIDEWRQRYAKLKSQNRSLRASTMGLGLSSSMDAGSLVRQEGLISDGGLVRDTDVTRFQLAVDDLLHSARQTSSDGLLASVKAVVVSVQALTAAVGTDGYPTPSPSPLGPDAKAQAPSVGKLKAQVTGTANSLITAAKQHAASHGLAPVALLDAAASHLTASVVALVKAVRIRPSNSADADSEYGDYDGMNADGMGATAGMGESEPLGLTRTMTNTKKPGGWFGWANKSNGADQEVEDYR